MHTVAIRRRGANLKRSFGQGILPTQDEIDGAWFLGLELGRKGVSAEPRRTWAAEVKAAFLSGHAEGEVTRAADNDADFEAFAALNRKGGAR